MKSIFGILLCVLAFGSLARADTVVFKNGDKLTGAFIQLRDKKLALKSDALGDVSVPLDKIQSLSVEKPAVILGPDRKLTRGNIELQASGNWQVTSAGNTETVNASEVTVILPADSYHAQAEVPSQPWQDWDGSVNFGYAIQRGDQKTSTLQASIVATRERPHDLFFSPHWRTNYGFNMLFAKAQQGAATVTSNTLTTSLRQDYLFTAQDFVFVIADLDHIDAQGLYLRQTYGGGLGRDLIHTDRTLLSAIGDIDFLHERFFVGPSLATVEASVGEKLGIQINRYFRFDHTLNFFPGLQHAGQYHGDGSANLGFKISRRFTANIGAIDEYLSNPSPGSRNNNVAFTTGLGYTF